MMRTVARVTLMVMLVAACGSADAGVSKTAAEQLHGEITLLRAASRAGDRLAARAQLVRLRAEIAGLRSRNELSAEAVRRLDAAIGAVEDRLSLLPPPTTTTTRPADEDHGKSDEDHGKGNKRKKDDD